MQNMMVPPPPAKLILHAGRRLRGGAAASAAAAACGWAATAGNPAGSRRRLAARGPGGGGPAGARAPWCKTRGRRLGTPPALPNRCLSPPRRILLSQLGAIQVFLDGICADKDRAAA
jgi:hypothetical protein